MTNIFFYSDKLRLLGKFLKFHFLKITRVCFFVFKRNKKLKKCSIDYLKTWRFENSYLLIKLNFENAIWYRIGRASGLNFNKIIVLDRRFLINDEVFIEIYGFFQKQVFIIDIKKEFSISTSSLQAEIKNFKNIGLNVLQPEIINSRINLYSNNYLLNISNVSMKNININLNYKPFKIQDFI